MTDKLTSFLVPPPSGQHRLFHGRGGCLPELDWLTLDRYPPLLVATLFAPLEAAELGRLVETLVAALPGLGCDALVMQHRYGGKPLTEVVSGRLPEQPVAEEAGLRFLLDFQRGQNIGFFPDMAPARAWLRERSADKSVLNLFSFSCAFSVAALAGGARRVVNIDLSKAALALGQRNHALNQLPVERAVFLPHDIFRSWKKLHSLGRYDLIVIDPPSEQKGSFVARRDYRKVIRHLHRLLQPDAQILACLNAPWLDEPFLDEVVLANLPGSEKQQRLPFAPGFAEADPDKALKVISYRYRRPAEL